MANLRNQVRLVGRLGQDPEVRHLDSGACVANFSMATSEKWKNKQGEWVDHTEWHNCVCWGALAEKVIEPYVKKGTEITVQGKLRTRSYEVDGVTKYTTEIIVDELLMHGGTSAQSSTAPPAGANTYQQSRQSGNTQSAKVQEPTNMNIDEDDDLPF